jgi:phage host-nuclease inhibitor protein Gam
MSDELSEFLLADLEGWDPPTDTEDPAYMRWSIVGYPAEERDAVATWAFRRLAALQEERARIVRAARVEVGRINEWAADADRPLVVKENFFRGCLTDYLIRIRAERGENPERPQTLSYKLPTGTITGRKQPESLVVLDEAKFIEWCDENDLPEFVRTKREVDKAAMKRLKAGTDGVSVILDTGERAPFVELRRAPEKFDAKPEVKA